MSRKRTAETYSSDDGFVEDAPSSKKSRNTSEKKRGSQTDGPLTMHKTKVGEPYWEVRLSLTFRLVEQKKAFPARTTSSSLTIDGMADCFC